MNSYVGSCERAVTYEVSEILYGIYILDKKQGKESIWFFNPYGGKKLEVSFTSWEQKITRFDQTIAAIQREISELQS